jgi:hypothetical protein
MSFQAFNAMNNFIDVKNIKQIDFLKGVAAYFKSAPNNAVNQAYVRSVGGQAIQNAVTQLWTNTPANLAGMAKLNHLYGVVDNYWNNTATPRGNQKLIEEQNARQTHWTIGLGANTVPPLDEYAKHGLGPSHLATLVITPRQVSGYMALLTAIIAPFVVETDFCKHNQNHKHAKQTRDAIAALNTHIALGNLTGDQGGYKSTDPKWTSVEEMANYWIKEIPNVTARRPTHDAIDTYAGAGKSVSLFRLVSAGEREFVTSKAQPTIAQGPASYERHKWFFAKGGDPGVGHSFKLELKLKGDGYSFLMDRAQEVNDGSKSTSPFALVKKANERECIGIHEELLAVFCQKMVTSIAGA